MKRIEIDQGSDAWKLWRRTVLTATDASVILGVNPWVTPFKLWQRKLGLSDEQISSAAMERGSKLEPIARKKFIEGTGIYVEPAVVVSEEHTFLGASLDGISNCGKYLLEVKCNGAKNHSLACMGEIPDYYIAQIKHQLLVTGSEICYYYSFDGENGVCIEVRSDNTFAEDYLPKAKAFWQSIVFFEAPPLVKGDYKDMASIPEWGQYAGRYYALDAEIKAKEKEKDLLRQQLISLCEDQACCGSGIKIQPMIIKGKISYDEIPEIKNIDLEKYRKESSSSWRITMDKT